MPQIKQPFPVDDPAVQALVRCKARRLCRAPGFQTQDGEDLAQSLLAGLLQRLGELNLRREHALAVVAAAVNQLGANLLRDRLALKRDDRRVQSLNTSVPGGSGDGPVEWAEAVTQTNLEARTGGRRLKAEDQVDLRMDVEAVLRRLPPDLRAVAERLKTWSVAEAARHLGVPRTTLHEAVRRLRRPFERAGLKDYLEQSPSP